MHATIYSNGLSDGKARPKGWYAWDKANETYQGPFPHSHAAYQAWCKLNGQLPVLRKLQTVYTMGDNENYLDANGLPLERGWYAWDKAAQVYKGPHKSMRLAYIEWCSLNGREPRGKTAQALDNAKRKALPALDLRLDADLPENIRALLDKPY